MNNYYENYFNLLKTKYNNQDIIGILEVDNTNIKEIIVKGSDNKYYLNHNLNHNYSIYGNTFMDYRNNSSDKKKLIFGHNIEVGYIPFKELEKFLDKDFFLKENNIYLTTCQGKTKYAVFSVMIVDESSNHMDLYYDNWEIYLKSLKENSIYQNKVLIEENDNILILQTCNFKPKNTYILVIAKEIQ